ncbi:hypothetical protein [Microbacterium album]|uniref:Lipoprotein n=1 Tax=Microbacterium album TaxID=2053191 RepID=A0A917IE82_9MICO|nr:hypothetical protein [Microbacterium album]GGH40884.1 hypothetical protein GCM10010921_13120 [Microbacterium album]
MRRGARRWGALLGAALLAALAGCATQPAGDDFPAGDARAITSSEAQQLAAVRLRNLTEGTRSVAFAVVEQSSELSFDGWFDYETGTGYGLLTDAEVPTLLLWNGEVAGEQALPDGADEAPLPIPDVDALATAWRGSALDPAASRLDAVLAVVAALGADRPENPLLLQQAGALWLGERTVDGAELTVFSGPVEDVAGATADPEAATTRYWLDESGLASRVDVRLGGEAAWTTIRYGDADGVVLGDPFAQGEPGAGP